MRITVVVVCGTEVVITGTEGRIVVDTTGWTGLYVFSTVVFRVSTMLVFMLFNLTPPGEAYSRDSPPKLPREVIFSTLLVSYKLLLMLFVPVATMMGVFSSMTLLVSMISVLLMEVVVGTFLIRDDLFFYTTLAMGTTAGTGVMDWMGG